MPRRWTDDEAEEFRALISSLMMATQIMGCHMTSQDPNKAAEHALVVHDVIHLMERRGLIEVMEEPTS